MKALKASSGVPDLPKGRFTDYPGDKRRVRTIWDAEGCERVPGRPKVSAGWERYERSKRLFPLV